MEAGNMLVNSAARLDEENLTFFVRGGLIAQDDACGQVVGILPCWTEKHTSCMGM